MITLSTGVTGSAKTYSHMPIIAHIMENSSNLLVTNLEELELGEWQKFLDERSKTHKTGWNDDVRKRIFIIPKTETSEYYRYRGTKTYEKFRVINGESIDECDKRLAAYFLQFEDDNRGVVYILDELHRHFKSERWADISPAVTFHLAQHRHLDDQFYGISQNPEQIAVRFNRQVHECFIWRNHYKEQFGIFGKPGCFRFAAYYYVPKSGSGNNIPFLEGKLYLDVNKWGKLYRTRGALGGKNYSPEVEKKRFKLPWWWMVIFGVVGFAFGVFLIMKIPKMFSSFLGHFMKSTKTVVTDGFGIKEPPVPTSFSKVPPSELPSLSSPTPVTQGHVDQSPPSDLRVTGLIVGVGRYNLSLSDGRVLTEDMHMVRHFYRNTVELADGTVIPFSVPVSRASDKRIKEQRPVEVTTPVVSSPSVDADSNSSWRTDADGVKRLRVSPSFTDSVPVVSVGKGQTSGG